MQIGDELREARRIRDVSLAQIEEETKIRKKYLAALEKNDFDSIPGEVYVKAFIKGYAEQVGLDGNKLVDKYINAKKRKKEQEKEEEIRRQKELENRKNKIKIIVVSAAILLIILVLGLIYIKEKDVESTDAGQNENLSSRMEAAVETSSEESVEDSLPPESNNNSNSATNSQQTGQKNKQGNIKIIASRRSWLQVEIDGEEVYSGFINDEETLDYTGKENLILKIGNGKAIKVNVNGEIKGPWGKSGEVMKKEINI
ncbi:MAG: helix-turn-helix domain-containing protein [Halanaerobiaceae bacterium]